MIGAVLGFGLIAGAASALLAVERNRPAPDFQLRNSQGERRSLKDYKGKVLLINFWASWCGPCQSELPELHRLARDYSRKSLRVLAINVDEKAMEGRKLLKRLGLQTAGFETLWDTRSKTVSAYNVAAMPSSVVVDRQGIVRHVHAGFRPNDPAAWRREIDALLR